MPASWPLEAAGVFGLVLVFVLVIVAGVGALFQIGAPIFNEGRAVVLPSGIPVPLRVFVLAWSLGGRTSS